MSRFVKETLPLATYGVGTGVILITANNALTYIQQAQGLIPVVTMMTGAQEIAAGGAAIVITRDYLKKNKAKFRLSPVLTGVFLGAALGAAVTAGSNKADEYLHERVERSFEQIEAPAPGLDR